MDCKEFFKPTWKKFLIVVALFLISKISLYATYIFGYGGASELIIYSFASIYFLFNPFALIFNFFFDYKFFEFFVQDIRSYPIILLYQYLLACIIVYFYRKIKNKKS